MRKLSSTFCVVSVVIGYFTLAACSQASDGKTEAQKLAAVLSSVLPKKMEQGIVLKSAVAEGDLLVLTTGGPSDWTRGWSEKEMSKMVAVGFCQADYVDRFFQHGGRVRFDISQGGNPPVEGTVLDHCPEKMS